MFDDEEGKRLKDVGMQLALDYSGEWKDNALAALRLFVRERKEFTGEQFRYWWLTNGGYAPPRHYCWGALFSHAARLGLMSKTGIYVSAQSSKTHSHPVAVWTRA